VIVLPFVGRCFIGFRATTFRRFLPICLLLLGSIVLFSDVGQAIFVELGSTGGARRRWRRRGEGRGRCSPQHNNHPPHPHSTTHHALNWVRKWLGMQLGKRKSEKSAISTRSRPPGVGEGDVPLRPPAPNPAAGTGRRLDWTSADGGPTKLATRRSVGGLAPGAGDEVREDAIDADRRLDAREGDTTGWSTVDAERSRGGGDLPLHVKEHASYTIKASQSAPLWRSPLPCVGAVFRQDTPVHTVSDACRVRAMRSLSSVKTLSKIRTPPLPRVADLAGSGVARAAPGAARRVIEEVVRERVPTGGASEGRLPYERDDETAAARPSRPARCCECDGRVAVEPERSRGGGWGVADDEGGPAAACMRRAKSSERRMAPSVPIRAE